MLTRLISISPFSLFWCWACRAWARNYINVPLACTWYTCQCIVSVFGRAYTVNLYSFHLAGLYAYCSANGPAREKWTIIIFVRHICALPNWIFIDIRHSVGFAEICWPTENKFELTQQALPYCSKTICETHCDVVSHRRLTSGNACTASIYGNEFAFRSICSFCKPHIEFKLTLSWRLLFISTAIYAEI